MPDVSTTSQQEKGEIVQPIERTNETTMKNNSKIIYGVYGLLIILGISTGYILSTKTSIKGAGSVQKATVINTAKVSGSTDAVFKDSAEGVIQKGGLDGEGSHNLVREGGPSQTAYLVSSIVDLDKYVGKKVKVWGQTMAAKNVSWLMDVGKVELISE